MNVTRLRQRPPRVDILPGPKRLADQLRTLWFHVGSLETPPPRNLSEVSTCLPRTQRRQLKRTLEDRRKPDFLTDSGGVDVILFCWERHGRPDLLVMAARARRTRSRRSRCKQRRETRRA